MHTIHRIVVLFGAFSIVGLTVVAGSVAHASNNEPAKPGHANTLREMIRQHNLTADGCHQ